MADRGRMSGTFHQAIDKNDCASGSSKLVPVRPAPPLPTKLSKEPVSQSKQTNLQGKEKGPKKMFSFMKSKENSNHASNNANKSRQSLKKKQKVNAPTIIRPVPSGNVQNTRKKKLPPRPPPPNINKGNSCIQVFPLDPPSYEEVLLADSTAQNRGAAFAKKSKTQAATTSTTSWLVDPFDPLCSLSVDDMYANVDINGTLIDLSSPVVVEKKQQQKYCTKEGKRSFSVDLLELTDVFNQMSANNGESDEGSNILQPSTKSLTELSSQNVEKPVPLPRKSLTSSKIIAPINEWPSCDEPAPELPPRPELQPENLDFISCSDSLSPPPPLPPRPKNYFDDAQETIGDLSVFSWQRTEPHGIALFDYDATQSDDLSFKTDDTVTLIHRINDDWLFGCLGDREGMFPRNFVEIVIPLPDDPEFQEDGVPTVSGPRCLALFDFVGDRDDELSFKVGDMIKLLSRINDHWLKGAIEDRIGLVPSNFVRIVEDIR